MSWAPLSDSTTEVIANDMTLSGGTIQGDGKVTLKSANAGSTLTLTGGTLNVAVDAGDADTDTDKILLEPLAGANVIIQTGDLSGFEELRMTSVARQGGTVTQSAITLTIATANFAGGGTYSIASGGILAVEELTVRGAAELAGAGETIVSETLTIEGGTVSGTVIVIDSLKPESDETPVKITIEGGTVSGMVSGRDNLESLSIAVTGGTISGTVQGSGAKDLIVVDGGTISGTLSSGANADSITFRSADATLTSTGRVDAGAGADTITLSAGRIEGTVDAGGGGDVIYLTGATITGTVMGGAGVDDFRFYTGTTLTGSLDGGSGNDIFNFISGTVAGEVRGDGGEDTFEIEDGTISGSLVGGSNNDVFNISGGTISATGRLIGGSDNDIFNISGGTITLGADIRGSGGNDKFNISGGNFNGSILYGEDGDDTFTFSAGQDAGVDGGVGEDIIVVDVTAGFYLSQLDSYTEIETVRYIGTSADTIMQSDTGELSGINLEIASAGVDYEIASAADGADFRSITIEDGTFSASGSITVTVTDYFTLQSGTVETIAIHGDATDNTFTIAGGTFSSDASIDGGAGNDEFLLSADFSGSINGGTGNDVFTLSSGFTAASIDGSIDGGAGNDEFILNSAFAGDIDGGADNDVFTLSAAFTGSLSGGAGSDTYTWIEGDFTGAIDGGESSGSSLAASRLTDELDTFIAANKSKNTTLTETQLGLIGNVEIFEVDTGDYTLTWGASGGKTIGDSGDGSCATTGGCFERLTLTSGTVNVPGGLTIASSGALELDASTVTTWNIGSSVTFNNGSTLEVSNAAINGQTLTLNIGAGGSLNLPGLSGSGDVMTIMLFPDTVANADLIINMASITVGGREITTEAQLTAFLQRVSVADGEGEVTLTDSTLTAGSFSSITLTIAQQAPPDTSGVVVPSDSYAPYAYANLSYALAHYQEQSFKRILDRIELKVASGDVQTGGTSWLTRAKPWLITTTARYQLDGATEAPGYSIDGFSVALGLDIRIASDTYFGSFIGRIEGQQKSDFDDFNNLPEADTMTYTAQTDYTAAVFGLYGVRQVGDLRLAGLLGYSLNNIKTRRNKPFIGDDPNITSFGGVGRYDLDALSIVFQGSWLTGKALFGYAIEPEFKLFYSQTSREGLVENITLSDGRTSQMRIAGEDSTSFASSININFTRHTKILRNSFKIGWLSKLKQDDSQAIAILGSSADNMFSYSADGRAQNGYDNVFHVSAVVGMNFESPLLNAFQFAEFFVEGKSDFDEFEGYEFGLRFRNTF